MTERLQGQRTADEVCLRVAATVHTIDEALTWIVRQLDQRDLLRPQGGFSPVWSYAPDTEETQQFFEVWISGEPQASGELGGA